MTTKTYIHGSYAIIIFFCHKSGTLLISTPYVPFLKSLGNGDPHLPTAIALICNGVPTTLLGSYYKQHQFLFDYSLVILYWKQKYILVSCFVPCAMFVLWGSRGGAMRACNRRLLYHTSETLMEVKLFSHLMWLSHRSVSNDKQKRHADTTNQQWI